MPVFAQQEHQTLCQPNVDAFEHLRVLIVSLMALLHDKHARLSCDPKEQEVLRSAALAGTCSKISMVYQLVFANSSGHTSAVALDSHPAKATCCVSLQLYFSETVACQCVTLWVETNARPVRHGTQPACQSLQGQKHYRLETVCLAMVT